MTLAHDAPAAAPTTLDAIDTPAALIDVTRMQRNIERMQQRARALGVALRPHVKTAKCLPVAQAQQAAGARGITVSTLHEAAYFHAQGFDDILYAVGVVPAKLPQVMKLRRAGCALKVIIDSAAAARALVDFGRAEDATLDVWIEVDTDGHRSGLAPDAAELLEAAHLLQAGGMTVGGVMTHAGSSYALNDAAALAALAEQERAGCVLAAQRIRADGQPCPVVSVGSTPTALSARQLDGVTELRAGVYAFFDLVMHNVGVARLDELALSVLTSVIGHQPAKGWAIVDAGWMAMSRDRGTASQARDFRYGQVCDLDGRPLPGVLLVDANQEHGIIAVRAADNTDAAGEAGAASIVQRFPLGTRLRILPNHACATGAQFPAYHPLQGRSVGTAWPRLHGW